MKINGLSQVKERELENIDNFEERFIKPLEIDNGFEIVDEIKEKINDIRRKVNEDIFTIVLFGSFSDGKSTVIKAITGEEDIEISPSPTTDEIEEYKYKDGLKIVDTPGLFSEEKEHSEKSSKYISEADLILYLVDAVNPLKESQHDVVKWLLKDLNKSDSLIFVINKIDTACDDIEDDESFNETVKIKKEAVLKVVSSFGIDFNPDKIIAIAADPDGEGYEYWKKNIEEYKELSRMDTLINKIDEFMNSQNNEELIASTTQSVLRDCAVRLNNGLEEFLPKLKDGLDIDKSEYNRKQEIFSSLEKNVEKSHQNFMNQLDELRREYVQKLNNINDPKELEEFLELYIGENFKYFEDEVNNIKKREMESLEEYSKNIAISINQTTESYAQKRSAMFEAGSKLGGKFSEAFKYIPMDKIRDGIVFIRNIAKIPYKFKPWQALKLAKRFKFASGAAGPIMDVISTILEIRKESAFSKNVRELKNMIEEVIDDVKNDLNYDDFIKNEFPIINEYHNSSKQEQKRIENLKKQYQKLSELQKELSLI